MSEELSAYVDGRAEPKQKALIERHLAECAQCAAELEQLRCLIDAIRATPPVRSPRSFALSPEMVRERPRRSWFDIWSALAPAMAGAAALLLAALFFVDYRLQSGDALTGAGAPPASSAPLAAQPADSAAPMGPGPLVAATAPTFVTATPGPAAEVTVAHEALAAVGSPAPSSEARSEFRSAPPPVAATVVPSLGAPLSAQGSSGTEEAGAVEEASEPEEPALAAAASAPTGMESTPEAPLTTKAALEEQPPAETSSAEAVAVPEAPVSVAEAPATTSDAPTAALEAPIEAATTEAPAPAALAAAPPEPASDDGTAEGSVGSVRALTPERPPALLLAQILAGILLIASLITWGARLVRRRA